MQPSQPDSPTLRSIVVHLSISRLSFKPPTVEGQLLGLADRMNTIVDMFAIDLKPTGSRDPFALRRAASGIVKIFGESELPLTTSQLSHVAWELCAHNK